MAEEIQDGMEETPGVEEAEEVRFEMRMRGDWYRRMSMMADLAAKQGIIPNDHRGNKTAWANYCFTMGEELLRQRANKKRGF